MRIWWAILFLLPLHASGDGRCEKDDSCNYSSMWGGFTELRLRYSGTRERKGSEYVYLQTPTESLMTFPVKNGPATTLSVPGVATLGHGIGTTGIKNSPSCYEDVGDTFAIVQSYAVRALFLLGSGLKGGPELVGETMTINVDNADDT